jgi:hypothetical protein
LATGAATNGAISIGTVNAESVTIGRTTKTVSIAGLLANLTDTKNRGQVVLDGATPGVATATVQASALCNCTATTTGVTAPACDVSGTTLTVTGGTADARTVTYHCF